MIPLDEHFYNRGVCSNEVQKLFELQGNSFRNRLDHQKPVRTALESVRSREEKCHRAAPNSSTIVKLVFHCLDFRD